MQIHIDSITAHFPNYFNELEQNDDINEDGNTEDINTEDDGTINNELDSNFDKLYGGIINPHQK